MPKACQRTESQCPNPFTDTAPERMAGIYRPKNFDFRFTKHPLKPVMGGFDWGRNEPWDVARQRARDYLIGSAWSPDGKPNWAKDWEHQMMFGTLQLPDEILQKAHLRLLGETTELPNSAAIYTIGFALFNPDRYYRFETRTTWEQFCWTAEFRYKRHQKRINDLEELLAERG